MIDTRVRKWVMVVAGLVIAVAVSGYALNIWLQNGKDQNLASGNGRVEAVEIDVSAKSAGRIKSILVKEGDYVTADQIVAVMDTEVLEAQRRQAEAQLQQAKSTLVTAHSQLAQREAEKVATLAVLSQREVELDIAKKRMARSSLLATEGASSQQEADDDVARVKGVAAAVSAVHAQVVAADAAIATAKAQVSGAAAAVEAVQANIERVQADIADSMLKAPRAGRIQYRVAQPGEVVGGGGRILNMVDLGDVYMTFFLPTAAAGKIALGSEVRLVLDAATQYVIPANVSFVADVAQFTPKTVETALEREKLMFRIRAQISAELLKKHIVNVKTGLPGIAYVRLDQATPWPDHLRVKLPE